VRLQKAIAVLAHDVGHLEGGRVTAGASAACAARYQALKGSTHPGDWRRPGDASARDEIQHRMPDIDVTEEELNGPKVGTTLQ